MCVGDNMEKNKKNKASIYMLIIVVIGVLFDQISKFYIRYIFSDSLCGIECIKAPCNCLLELLEIGGKYNGLTVVPGKGIEVLNNFFYITNVNNTGGAWGIFSGNVLFLSIISIFVIILLYFFFKEEKNINKLSVTYYGLLFAGIIGNLIDRVMNGYVTDFLNFYIIGYDYPVFNIADILIVLGIVLMIIDVVRGEIHVNKERKRKHTN